MKRLLSLVILTLIIPQVALAAWWNPVSWFKKIFRPSEPKVEVLEERIKELEGRLESFDNATTTEDKEIENEQTIKPESNPVQVPVQTQTQTSVVNTYTVPSVEELIKSYTDFREKVKSELNGLDRSSSLHTEREYHSYLEDLLDKVDGDLEYLWTVKSWTQIPTNIESVYVSKFDELQKEYQSKAATYIIEREKNEESLSRQIVIDYIYDNKFRLYEASIHVKAAELLYLFDKLFSTNYAKEFESRKTQVETVEFANRFLIDQGY